MMRYTVDDQLTKLLIDLMEVVQTYKYLLYEEELKLATDLIKKIKKIFGLEED